MPGTRRPAPRAKGRTITHKRQSQTSQGVSKKRMKDPIGVSFWREDHTVTDNYTALGLAVDVNANAVKVRNPVPARTIVNSLSSSHQAADIRKAALKEIEEKAANAAPPRTFVYEGEFKFLAMCREKHGEDYQAMARDRKLNTHQHTANQLRKKMANLDKYIREKRAREEN